MFKLNLKIKKLTNFFAILLCFAVTSFFCNSSYSQDSQNSSVTPAEPQSTSTPINSELQNSEAVKGQSTPTSTLPQKVTSSPSESPSENSPEDSNSLDLPPSSTTKSSQQDLPPAQKKIASKKVDALPGTTKQASVTQISEDLGQDFISLITQIWTYKLFKTADKRWISIKEIILGVILILFGYFLSKKISQRLGRQILPRFKLTSGAIAAVESLTFYTLLVIFSFTGLHLINFPTTVFTLLGGAIAIGLGFGSQNLMNNFISGLIMLIEQPIRPGDLIEIDSHQATVKRIGARSTIVVTKANVDILVPNSELLQKQLINWTLSDNKVKHTIKVGVAYESDIDFVTQTLLGIAERNPQILKTPKPAVLIKDFAESSVEMTLNVWIVTISFTEAEATLSNIRKDILKVFKEEKIVIPYPQRVITKVGSI